ncbi:hypothetical protein KSP39_PZI012453 [Platanthera zijinensis]|uniref:Uncharacterized protein n=1 Tax=Platanthera zijinensis TaxID=2320716 RepID=A0AAP0BF31_9ASPA
MNHLPEKRADEDHDQPPPPPSPMKSPAASPAAVSFGNDIHHRYYDSNAALEKDQSSSSSDSDSDDEDFFQLEATELSIPAGKPPMAPPAFTENEIGLSAKSVGWKPPPPARYDVPDPNRIPMSVFARNPAAAATPKDWSVASNESLFSIQMGNSSFSREQGLLLMGRSGELGGATGWPSEYPPPRPPPTRAAAEAAAAGGKEMPAEANEAKKEGREEEVVVVVVEGETKEKASAHLLGHSISRQSDCSSTTSFRSFAFPVLTRDEKNESIRVMARQHTEHQPPPLVNPLMASAPPPAAATGPWTPSTTGAISSKRRWFPCFTWCGFCC